MDDRTLRRSSRGKGDLCSRIEAILLTLFILATIAWRVSLLHHEPVNPDEIFLVAGAYRVNQGVLPFVHFIEVHAPFIYKAYGPLVAAIGERPDFPDLFRWLHWVLGIVFNALLFVLVKRAFDGKVALWSLSILNAFVYYTMRTVHGRPDFPAFILLFGALFLLMGREDRPRTPARLLLGGVGFGLATSFHLAMAFPTAALFAWLFLEGRKEGSPSHGVKAAFLFGSASIAVYLGSYVFVYGGRALEALTLHGRMFTFNRINLAANDHIHSLQNLKRIVTESPLAWLLVGLAFVLYNLRWLKGDLKRSRTRLFVLLTDLGIPYVLIQAKKVESYYFLLTIFGSVLAALMIKELTSGALRGGRWMTRGGVGLATASIFVAVSVASAVQFDGELNKMEQRDAEELGALKASFRMDGGLEGAQDPGRVRLWLEKRTSSFRAFDRRPRRQRIAQIRFMLSHSNEGDAVLTDWLNPPFRRLPANIHHGQMFSIFSRSGEIREDSEIRRLLSRYDPYYTLEDRSEEEHMIRLLEATRPALILLDGSLAMLFCDSARFAEWIAQRYRFELEPESGTFFALRRDRQDEG